jgi:hypothetical protein
MSAQTLSFGGVGGSAFSGYPPLVCNSGQALPNNSSTPANSNGQRYVRIQSVNLGLRSGSYPSGFRSFAGSTSVSATNGSQLSTTTSATWYAAGSTITYGAVGYFPAIYNFNRTGTGSISDNNGTSWVGDLQASISIVTFPTAPTSVTVTSVTATTATLSWSAPSDNGGATINGYGIEANDGSGWEFINEDTGSSATTATVSVSPSTTYQFRVGAITTLTRDSYVYVAPVYTIVGALSSASASVTTPASTAPVPNLAGLTASAANTAITNAGFTVGTVTTTTVGAYSGNNATVASQSPTSGTSALLGSAVSYQLFDYVAPTFPPVWSDSTLAAFTQLSPYSDGVSATNSPTYSVSVGSLPAGISLNTTTGAVTGTPTTTGSYSFTLRAANVDGAVTQAFSGTVGAPVPGKVWVNVSGTWQRCNVYVFNSSNAPVLATVKTTTNGTTWTSSL